MTTGSARRRPGPALVPGVGSARHRERRVQARPRDGQYKLIECNLRLTAADDLVRRAGVDLGWLGVPPRRSEIWTRPAGAPNGDGFRTGLVQWLPGRDLLALRQYVAEGELSVADWARTLRPPLSTPLFSIRDPRASLVNAVRGARTWIRRG